MLRAWSLGDAQPGCGHGEEAGGGPLTFSPAWILKDTPRTASGSSGRYLSPKFRNSICPPRGQGGRAAQLGGLQGAWGRSGHWVREPFFRLLPKQKRRPASPTPQFPFL